MINRFDRARQVSVEANLEGIKLGEANTQVRAPMAIAVVGGLMTSTLLTLIVIPVIYTYMESIQVWFFKVFAKTAARQKA